MSPKCTLFAQEQEILHSIVTEKPIVTILVLLGEVDEYEPLSRAAFYKSMLRDKVRNMKVNDPEEISPKQKQSNA